MNKNDFLNDNGAYIDSLKGPGELLTADKWRDWIAKECKEYNHTFEEHEINWIIEELEESGLVLEPCYIVIDDCDTDVYEKEFSSKEDAIKAAKDDFSNLTKTDLKRRKAFYVLESKNPDKDAPDHYDGDIILDLLAEN